MARVFVMRLPDTERSRGGQELAPAHERDERKERVLHTRVPQSLDRHIKRRAQSLGMSVSTVVRHILANTFGLVDDIVADSTNIALTIAGEPAVPDRRRAAGAEVVGWQEAVLNVNAVCDGCNAALARGSRAAIGVRERPGPRTTLCRRCLRRVVAPDGARPARGRRR